jgi:hypothetical protein
MVMFAYSMIKRASLAMAVLAGLAPATIAAAASATPSMSSQATARVWFLRPTSYVSGGAAAAPMIYANGAPIAAMPAGSEFYRDLPAGSYRFTVQPYGLPTGQADTVRLAPGSQTYLEVQWAPTWEEGYAGGGGSNSHSFFVLNLAPQLAQAYLPSLTNLGQN